MSDTLTERERQVVRLVSLGCNLKEIGRILKMSPNTVDNHKMHAMAKLGTDKAALLTRIAIQQRITTLRDRLTPTEKRRRGRRKDGWN